MNVSIKQLIIIVTTLFSGFSGILYAQSPLPKLTDSNQRSDITRAFITPVRIVWTSDNGIGKVVQNAGAILKTGTRQADLNSGNYLRLISGENENGGIVLDFGREIEGGIEIITTATNKKPAGKVRIRFGESVSEAMSEIGQQGSTNDHAIRDQIVSLPWLGHIEVGESGFRFMRIDVMDSNDTIEIKEINAVSFFRDIPYLGTFKCNDEKLNKIWQTGAYTVHLNMQDYLWDGIKRDRLVWVGDLHPEIMTICSVFGYNEVVPKSLDLARSLTPLPAWFNGISSYSMWWIIIQRDWYNYRGNLTYLKQQQAYMSQLLHLLSTYIDKNGKETLDGTRFLDWPSSENPEAIHAGLQSLMVMAFQAGNEISQVLQDKETASLCEASLKKLKKHVPHLGESKQAAALLSLSGLVPAKEADQQVLSRNGVHGMSTFYGYYMLEAKAKAGDYQGAIDNIRDYWGSMLDLGATTFWEDFNIDWMKNAGRIDELVSKDKVDVHSTYGAYCYTGYRHSLCHGWASGPTSWMSRYILGVEPLEPGCKKVRISPHLGNLEWAEGTFPTPYGLIKVRYVKQPDGTVTSTVDAPKEIEVVK